MAESFTPSRRSSRSPMVRPMDPSLDVPSMKVQEEDREVLFAIPKKGRLNEEVMKLLQGAGLNFKRPDRLDVAHCTDLPVKLVFLPAKDIPMYVMDGNVDVGISGTDMLEENMKECGFGWEANDAKPPLTVPMKLGFGKCKLCLQAPAEMCNLPPQAFVGKRIVTSFPALTKKFFDGLSTEDSKPTRIKVVSGSVEAAVGLGLADAIVDLVETGTTMKAAGLDIVSDIQSTEAIVMQQVPNETNGMGGAKGDLVELLLKRMKGFLIAQRSVYLVFNCHEDNLEACCKVAPGKKSPTITRLQETGWYSASVLIDKGSLHVIMDNLTAAGATDILCTALSNTRM